MATTRLSADLVRRQRSRSDAREADSSVRDAAPATTPAAAVIDLTKIFSSGEASLVALDHVTVDFPAQRFTAIMGPSGSGKSTLLHCAAGLDRPTGGRVFVGGTDITKLDERALALYRRDHLGFVFQAYNLIPTLTAHENIVLPAALAGRQPDFGWVSEITEMLGLTDRLHHRPSELSGGQQQRVAIARALVSRPEIVFADEPTGSVDSRVSGEILRFFKRAVRELGQTIVMVTHDPVAAGHADSVLFLSDGHVVDELALPTAEGVLDRLKKLGA